jgi:hypothetical protein
MLRLMQGLRESVRGVPRGRRRSHTVRQVRWGGGKKRASGNKPEKSPQNPSAVVQRKHDKSGGPTDTAGVRYVSSYRANKRFQDRRMGYMSWNVKGWQDPACKPS